MEGRRKEERLKQKFLKKDDDEGEIEEIESEFKKLHTKQSQQMTLDFLSVLSGSL